MARLTNTENQSKETTTTNSNSDNHSCVFSITNTIQTFPFFNQKASVMLLQQQKRACWLIRESSDTDKRETHVAVECVDDHSRCVSANGKVASYLFRLQTDTPEDILRFVEQETGLSFRDLLAPFHCGALAATGKHLQQFKISNFAAAANQSPSTASSTQTAINTCVFSFNYDEYALLTLLQSHARETRRPCWLIRQDSNNPLNIALDYVDATGDELRSISFDPKQENLKDILYRCNISITNLIQPQDIGAESVTLPYLSNFTIDIVNKLKMEAASGKERMTVDAPTSQHGLFARESESRSDRGISSGMRQARELPRKNDPGSFRKT